MEDSFSGGRVVRKGGAVERAWEENVIKIHDSKFSENKNILI